MNAVAKESTAGKLTTIRSVLMEIVSVWLAGMLAGQIVVFAFIADFREVRYVSSQTDWLLALGLLLLALAIPAVVIYTEFREA